MCMYIYIYIDFECVFGIFRCITNHWVMTNHVSSAIIILQYAFHYLIFDYRCPKHPPFEKYQTSDFPALPPKSRIFRGCSLLWLRPNSNYWSISLLGPELPGLTRMFLKGYTTSKWPFQREQFIVFTSGFKATSMGVHSFTSPNEHGNVMSYFWTIGEVNPPCGAWRPVFFIIVLVFAALLGNGM